jgi:hypothetical protein
MGSIQASARAQRASIEAVVTRCRCEDRSPHTTEAAWAHHFYLAQSTDLGTVAYCHKNPIKRLVYRLTGKALN